MSTQPKEQPDVSPCNASTLLNHRQHFVSLPDSCNAHIPARARSPHLSSSVVLIDNMNGDDDRNEGGKGNDPSVRVTAYRFTIRHARSYRVLEEVLWSQVKVQTFKRFQRFDVMYHFEFTEIGLSLGTWFGETCSRPCLASRNKFHQDFSRSLY